MADFDHGLAGIGSSFVVLAVAAAPAVPCVTAFHYPAYADGTKSFCSGGRLLHFDSPTGTLDELAWLGIAELGPLLRRKEISVVELVRSVLARIEKLQPRCHAFLLTTPELALVQAAQADAELASGQDRGPLHGVPYALKDLANVAGLPTTCHSLILAGNVAATDAEVVKRLRHAGAVLVGKTSLHEFATGGPAFESHRSWMLYNVAGLVRAGMMPAENPINDTARNDVILLKPTHIDSDVQPDGSIAVTYRFEKLPLSASEYRFRYVAPTLILDVPLDFELRGVPLRSGR